MLRRASSRPLQIQRPKTSRVTSVVCARALCHEPVLAASDSSFRNAAESRVPRSASTLRLDVMRSMTVSRKWSRFYLPADNPMLLQVQEGGPSCVKWMCFARQPQCRASEMILFFAHSMQSPLKVYSRSSLGACVLSLITLIYCSSKCSRDGLSVKSVRNCTNAPMCLLHAAAHRCDVSHGRHEPEKITFAQRDQISSPAPAFHQRLVRT